MNNINRLEQLLQFLEQSPDDAFLNYCIALEYIKKEDFDAALRYFNYLIDNHPEYTGTYYHLGKLYVRLHKKEDAIKIYDSGLVITKRLEDHHAYSELLSAKNEILNDYDVEFDD
ncbi:MAG TPA: hypothetical protein VFM99_09430 [Chitinophagales bacterium]|nr:hypothetical protein [Chitinophagales bacterium]